MTKLQIQRHLAELIDHERCVRLPETDMSKLRAGTYPAAKFQALVDRVRSERCGFVHSASLDPRSTSRLEKLSAKRFKIFRLEDSPDNVFHAFLQSLSFIIHGRPLPAKVLKQSTKTLRARIVDVVLRNKALQNTIDAEPSQSYHRQFEVRNGNVGQRSFVQYGRRMSTNAYASYPELHAITKSTHFEIHVYDRASGASSFTFVQRIKPSAQSHSRRYVLRLVRRHKPSGMDHFDILIPSEFLEFSSVLGKRAVNSPEKALQLLKNVKTNKNGTKNNNISANLPYEADLEANAAFSWSNSPKLGSTPKRKNNTNTPKKLNVFASAQQPFDAE